MMRRLERRRSESRLAATLLRAPAEDLPFEDDSFAAAVSTLVLCTVDDQSRALRQPDLSDGIRAYQETVIRPNRI